MIRVLIDNASNAGTYPSLDQAARQYAYEHPEFDTARLSVHPDDLAAEDDAKRRAALDAIDQLHAKALISLCGQATVEERDTWPVKIAAAEAVLTGSASEAQLAMLTAEVGEDQSDIEALANKIIFKSAMYQRVVGIAAKLRADGKRSLEGLDTADLPAALKEIERKSQMYVAEKAAEMVA